MQANTITLAVDILNSGSTTNQAFERVEEQVNRSTYNGPGHTFASRNQMQFYRTNPVRSGAFLGAVKSSVKFTEDVTVDDAEGNDRVAPAIAECSFSIPVGTTAAKTLELRQRMIAALDMAFMASLVDQGII